MSQPNIKAEQGEFEEELKKECAREVGMVVAGRNSDGEQEFIGTDKQWKEYMTLLEDKLNEF